MLDGQVEVLTAWAMRAATSGRSARRAAPCRAGGSTSPVPDRSCIDGAVLQAMTTSALWLYVDGTEVSVPMRDVVDVWEVGR